MFCTAAACTKSGQGVADAAFYAGISDKLPKDCVGNEAGGTGLSTLSMAMIFTDLNSI